MDLISSQLLSVTHGFPTRAGGVSVGPYASLNASTSVGDAPEAVALNLERLARAAGGLIATVTQVHGSVVLAVPGAAPDAAADGLWTEAPGRAIGVRTADCVPILIEDRVGRRVAAVHAGWRGVEGRIVEVAVRTLLARGSLAGDLRVALGPCIQRCCLEVQGDLPVRFAAAFGAEVVVSGRRGLTLDLPLALERSLAVVGVGAAQVDRLPACTACDDRFFSHRRDHGLTGRHLNFIACDFHPPDAAAL